MLKSFVFLVATFLAAILVNSPAVANDLVSVVNGFGNDRVEVSGHRAGGEQSTTNTPSATKHGTAGAGSGVVDPYAGMTCYQVWLETYQKTCDYVAPGETCNETIGPVAGPAIPLCTVVEPTNPAAQAARQQGAARAYALDYFKSLPLPIPQPKLSAQEGITGARHQLDLQISPTATFKDPETTFGALTMDCYGSFTVNWGDGTKNTYSVTGAPYPKSTIVHSWAKRGHYIITVTANWSADWSFGTYSGTLSGLSTTATIADFPVGDLQAVVRNY